MQPRKHEGTKKTRVMSSCFRAFVVAFRCLARQRSSNVPNRLERALADGLVVQRAVDQAVQAVHFAACRRARPVRPLACRPARSGRRCRRRCSTASRRPPAARTTSSRLVSKKWQCEPTCTGRSPRLVTSMRHVGRPALISIGSSDRKYSPGIIWHTRTADLATRPVVSGRALRRRHENTKWSEIVIVTVWGCGW